MTQSKTVNITLTIPAPLRERMREHGGLNWSGLASRAFEEAIEVAGYKRDDPDIPAGLRKIERERKLQKVGVAALRALKKEGLIDQ